MIINEILDEGLLDFFKQKSNDTEKNSGNNSNNKSSETSEPKNQKANKMSTAERWKALASDGRKDPLWNKVLKIANDYYDSSKDITYDELRDYVSDKWDKMLDSPDAGKHPKYDNKDGGEHLLRDTGLSFALRDEFESKFENMEVTTHNDHPDWTEIDYWEDDNGKEYSGGNPKYADLSLEEMPGKKDPLYQYAQVVAMRNDKDIFQTVEDLMDPEYSSNSPIISHNKKRLKAIIQDLVDNDHLLDAEQSEAQAKEKAEKEEKEKQEYLKSPEGRAEANIERRKQDQARERKAEKERQEIEKEKSRQDLDRLDARQRQKQADADRTQSQQDRVNSLSRQAQGDAAARSRDSQNQSMRDQITVAQQNLIQAQNRGDKEAASMWHDRLQGFQAQLRENDDIIRVKTLTNKLLNK